MEKYYELIKEAFQENLAPCRDPEKKDEWARLGFYVAYHLFRTIRERRHEIGNLKEIPKSDGSPATALEFDMEKFARASLKSFYEPAVFLGEESGGDSDTDEFLFVIDPIDGTRSFLSGFDTFSITLSILKNRIPQFSIVCVASSGDVYFRIGSERSMLFQIRENLEDLKLYELPLIDNPNERPILINIHPSTKSLPYLERLLDMWDEGEIALVRSVSGSPSLLMVEAAKSGTFYVNTWEKGPTRPYDLIPALHIVNASNCQALRRDGQQVDVWTHRGFYMVGPSGGKLTNLLSKMPRF
jgi:fructose-1,6-bisphosphatase/inositol monophosphatase family enzyme